MLGYFYAEPQPTVELLANAKQKVTPEQLPEFLDAAIAAFDALPADRWTEANILAEARVLCEQKGYKLGQILWPVRAALTGREYSPGAVEVAAELGKDAAMRRLRAARAIAA